MTDAPTSVGKARPNAHRSSCPRPTASRPRGRRRWRDVDFVSLWADGIHVDIRLEEHKLCLLVMIGVRADGRKELVALADGYRESRESWADLPRDCQRRGMRAPVLAVGDGALGFWGALREVFPQAREQRCWFHKIANVLGALPKSAHPGAKHPKAVAQAVDDLDDLLAFYDFPAEHWQHLRTTNLIESTFATVRHRTKVTKGPGSRAVNASHLVALVRAGATFTGGKLVERPEERAA